MALVTQPEDTNADMTSVDRLAEASVNVPPAFQTRYVELIGPTALPAMRDFTGALANEGHTLLLRDQIEKRLDEFLGRADALGQSDKAGLQRLFRGCQEMLLIDGISYAVLRPKIGQRRYVRLQPDAGQLEEVSRLHYLEAKDALVQGHATATKAGLQLDFSDFFRGYPKVKDPGTMGRGMSVLNKHLSGQMHQSPQVFQRALMEFLQQCRLGEREILLNRYVSSPADLLRELANAMAFLADQRPETPYAECAHGLSQMGFEAGWGRDAATALEGLLLLEEVLESSDAARFESFLGRLPLAQNVLMVSPHGWFAQRDVLGKPDTGGQVTYVLDQARAIERYLRALFQQCGIEAAPKVLVLTRLIPDAEGTSCDEPLERIVGAENGWIVRVPFRDSDENVLPHWVSRFQIWPYIEDFATESVGAVRREFMGRPDLILGHYSDGNLAAYLMAESLGVTHCACVHALEKTKYLFSDLNWADMEEDYRFSLQFTADLLAYNAADFVVTSSFREIAGTSTEMGMFESYQTFTMPGLYRVVSGFDPQLARYNIVPPGVSEEHFFSFAERARRTPAIAESLAKDILGQDPGPEVIGRLNDPDKPPVFAMSRVDKVKNLSGLVELYGKSQKLREKANLVIISSITDPEQSGDQEERDELSRIYSLVDQYDLEGSFRWCAIRLSKAETGEVYRVMADRRGVFAQPALMETFGLTVTEAMACGLPVVVTCFGGPAEIVQPGDSGEVVDPNDHERFAEALTKTVSDTERWERLSKGGMDRVEAAYNWDLHARRVLGLSNIYTYWNYLDVMNRGALDQYIHTLFHTVYRPRVDAMNARG